MTSPPILLPPVGPLVAARAYLLGELTARDNPLPVDVQEPGGTPACYALLSTPGSDVRTFLGDYVVRVRIFDNDAVRLERNGNLIHRLMLHAVHRKITTTEGDVTITASKHHFGPADLDDPDVPMLGKQVAVIWTIGLRPEK